MDTIASGPSGPDQLPTAVRSQRVTPVASSKQNHVISQPVATAYNLTSTLAQYNSTPSPNSTPTLPQYIPAQHSPNPVQCLPPQFIPEKEHSISKSGVQTIPKQPDSKMLIVPDQHLSLQVAADYIDTRDDSPDWSVIIGQGTYALPSSKWRGALLKGLSQQLTIITGNLRPTPSMELVSLSLAGILMCDDTNTTVTDVCISNGVTVTDGTLLLRQSTVRHLAGGQNSPFRIGAGGTLRCLNSKVICDGATMVQFIPGNSGTGLIGANQINGSQTGENLDLPRFQAGESYFVSTGDASPTGSNFETTFATGIGEIYVRGSEIGILPRRVSRYILTKSGGSAAFISCTVHVDRIAEVYVAQNLSAIPLKLQVQQLLWETGAIPKIHPSTGPVDFTYDMTDSIGHHVSSQDRVLKIEGGTIVYDTVVEDRLVITQEGKPYITLACPTGYPRQLILLSNRSDDVEIKYGGSGSNGRLLLSPNTSIIAHSDGQNWYLTTAHVNFPI